MKRRKKISNYSCRAQTRDLWNRLSAFPPLHELQSLGSYCQVVLLNGNPTPSRSAVIIIIPHTYPISLVLILLRFSRSKHTASFPGFPHFYLGFHYWPCCTLWCSFCLVLWLVTNHCCIGCTKTAILLLVVISALLDMDIIMPSLFLDW